MTRWRFLLGRLPKWQAFDDSGCKARRKSNESGLFGALPGLYRFTLNQASHYSKGSWLPRPLQRIAYALAWRSARQGWANLLPTVGQLILSQQIIVKPLDMARPLRTETRHIQRWLG